MTQRLSCLRHGLPAQSCMHEPPSTYDASLVPHLLHSCRPVSFTGIRSVQRLLCLVPWLPFGFWLMSLPGRVGYHGRLGTFCWFFVHSCCFVSLFSKCSECTKYENAEIAFSHSFDRTQRQHNDVVSLSTRPYYALR